MQRFVFLVVFAVILEKNGVVEGGFRKCDQRPKAAGPCRAYMKRYSYVSSSMTCEPFIYGGCAGTSNRFESKQDCLNTCRGPCNQRPNVTGPCRAFFPRYSYDPALRKCVQFIYGGCRGNKNNFRTLAACQDKCIDPCRQPHSVTGPCRGFFPRYSYNQKLRKCVRFIYGGCPGNTNNFPTLKACEKRCVDPCKQKPSVAGPCRGSFPRYSYNPKLKRCVRFTYGGCKGNANNFYSKAICRKRCEDGCFQKPAVRGPCRGFFRRYSYDPRIKRCVSFIYGGCLGNGNNYFSRLQCLVQCRILG